MEMQMLSTAYSLDLIANFMRKNRRRYLHGSIGSQLNPIYPDILKKETANDPVLSTVMRYMKEAWPKENDNNQTGTEGFSINDFRELEISLLTDGECLLYSTRVIIPLSLQRQIVQRLHLRHFAMQRMKTTGKNCSLLARIDQHITDTSHNCTL